MKNEEFLLIEYSELFKIQLNKVPLEIKNAFKEVRDLFYDYPDHPSLRNHSLIGKYTGFRSIDVTGDWRAVFKIRKTKLKTIITFYLLGTHDQLYG